MVSTSSIQKKTPGGEPSAKFEAGNRGVAPRDEISRDSFGKQSTKFRGNRPSDLRGIAPHSLRRNLYAENAQNSSTLSTLTTQELTKEVQCLVLQFRTNEVVEDTQASLRAIENIRNGESGMSLKTFVNLCRRNPRARAIVGPMLGYGLESDPNVVQAISVLMNQLVRQEAETDETRDSGTSASPPREASSPDDCADSASNAAVGDFFAGIEQ